MAIVTVPAADRRITDPAEIAAFLADHGIHYERWPLEDRVDPASPAETILAAYAPELDAGLAKLRSALAKGRALGPILKKVYPTLVKISVDYALLEKSTNVVMLPASFDWDDVGAWPAVSKHFKPDAAGNVGRGEIIVEQGGGNIVFSEGGHLVALLGVDDLVVVHTKDATLVMPKAKAQDIKALLKRVAERKDAAKLL